MPRRVVIRRRRRVFDDFFKIDELLIAHEKTDGAVSAPLRRLVFERGDSVAVLLFHVERKSVLLVEQFRAPALLGRRRDDPTSTDGWIVETVAGMIGGNETGEAAAIRETLEETGYQIGTPQPIGKFFSSPGGSSERVFLYVAEVREADRSGRGGGIADEDIKFVQLPISDLFDRLGRGAIEDPKLWIAAYWLRDRLKWQGSTGSGSSGSKV